MALRHLSAHGFRNLKPLDLAVPAGVIAVLGPNGSGKSNLLEAIAVLGNLASFRPGSPVAWIQREWAEFRLAGVIDRGDATATVSQTRSRVRSAAKLFRGARRLGAGEYLALFPVTALSSRDRQLVWGPPEERRRFLDRLAFHLHAETLPTLQRYRHVLRQRNALLQRGGRGEEFDAFEHDLGSLGAALMRFRTVALYELERHLGGALETLGWSLPRPILRYHGGEGQGAADLPTLVRRLRAELNAGRRREQARGFTLVGPHRHDLVLTVHGMPAREVLSAGQGKVLVTAMKLGAMAAVRETGGGRPTVVFDDVDAELDGDVLSRVLRHLGESGQALLSSAHEEMVAPRLRAAAVWRIRDGVVEVSGGEGS